MYVQWMLFLWERTRGSNLWYCKRKRNCGTRLPAIEYWLSVNISALFVTDKYQHFPKSEVYDSFHFLIVFIEIKLTLLDGNQLQKLLLFLLGQE